MQTRVITLLVALTTMVICSSAAVYEGHVAADMGAYRLSWLPDEH